MDWLCDALECVIMREGPYHCRTSASGKCSAHHQHLHSVGGVRGCLWSMCDISPMHLPAHPHTNPHGVLQPSQAMAYACTLNPAANSAACQ
jgi:hypothetical protein